MFGQLPKLFDRNFATGYFLPVATFLSVSLIVVNGFGLLPAVLDINTVGQVDVLVGSTLIGLLSWLGGICLLAMNRDILRLMEGYGHLNPARLLAVVERRRYRRIKQQISRLDEQYSSCITQDKVVPEDLRQERSQLMRKIVERFPDQEQWLLPTPFGNIIRAFEVYPRVMYGLDSIPGWNRLLAVIPEDYRGLVDDAKAQVDFWMNLWLLSLMALIEYAALAIYTAQVKAVWFLPAAVCVTLVASSRARSSAGEWGDLVKSSFDVFLPELRKKLGFTDPAGADEERRLWRGFSQAIIYGLPECLPEHTELSTDADRTATNTRASLLSLVKLALDRITSRWRRPR